MNSQQNWWIIAILLCVAAFVGWHFSGTGLVDQEKNLMTPAEDEAHDHASRLYMCPMMCVDPQPKPGRCPVCGMDLVPMPEETASGSSAALHLSPAARTRAQIETAPAMRQFLEHELRLSGMIDVDETRVKEISAWVSGRLERIYVDQTGTVVREGDPLVEIYSPTLNAEKATYLATVRGDLSEWGVEAVTNRDEWLRNTRARLHLMGMTTAQIVALEAGDNPGYTENILAPIGGTVLHKSAIEGMHVNEGEHLYTVADLSRVWVWLDAYESDIARLRYGQEVTLQTEAYGDREFPGWISFIDPTLDPVKRVVRVRVLVDNEDGRLKPKMLVRARVHVRIGVDGAILPSKSFVDKWISPRHPEIVRDDPGDCPVCGIKLVRAAQLGYADENKHRPPLVIPATAVLYTGTRSVVYRERTTGDKTVYDGVSVTLGPRVGDHYVVLDGLEEGERIAVQGAFRIDSALQLSGQLSMMRSAPESKQKSSEDHSHHQQPLNRHDAMPPMANRAIEAPHAFRVALADAVRAYLAVQNALASDNSERAKTAIGALQAGLFSLPLDGLSEQARSVWDTHGLAAMSMAGEIHQAESIAEQRQHFEPLSIAFLGLAKTFHPLPGLTLYRVRCPMAFNNRGADWLQDNPDVFNPYEGKRMPHCGFVVKTIGEDTP